jgi:hypothetical protein
MQRLVYLLNTTTFSFSLYSPVFVSSAPPSRPSYPRPRLAQSLHLRPHHAKSALVTPPSESWKVASPAAPCPSTASSLHLRPFLLPSLRPRLSWVPWIPFPFLTRRYIEFPSMRVCFMKYCYIVCYFWNCLYFFYYSWNWDYDDVLAVDDGTASRDGFFTVLGIMVVNSIGNVWLCIVLSVCLLCLGIMVARILKFTSTPLEYR